MKKIVIIGGGHGQATLVKGIKDIDDIEFRTIVTVADDGGSTGRLRELYNIPAVGDIRSVLVSMSEKESFFNDLFDYRFQGSEEKDVVGHSFGNLLLAALIDLNNGSLNKAIKDVGKFLNVKGRVIPSSLELLTLNALYCDGTIVKGEAHIPDPNRRIDRVYYDHPVSADVEALEAIMNADLIIYGIGSLYTSILPITIIEEIKDALQKAPAKKVYFANCMSQVGETNDYDLKDHVDALRKHGALIDLIIRHNDVIPDYILKRYALENSIEIKNNGGFDIPVIERELLDFSNNNVRHDPCKIRAVVEELLRDI